jgi:hypothetical protein
MRLAVRDADLHVLQMATLRINIHQSSKIISAAGSTNNAELELEERGS